MKRFTTQTLKWHLRRKTNTMELYTHTHHSLEYLTDQVHPSTCTSSLNPPWSEIRLNDLWSNQLISNLAAIMTPAAVSNLVRKALACCSSDDCFFLGEFKELMSWEVFWREYWVMCTSILLLMCVCVCVCHCEIETLYIITYTHTDTLFFLSLSLSRTHTHTHTHTVTHAQSYQCS